MRLSRLARVLSLIITRTRAKEYAVDSIDASLHGYDLYQVLYSTDLSSDDAHNHNSFTAL